MKTALERPIVILGAARSGTKILRSAISAHPLVAEVPHDINQVWKYGNYSLPHDEIDPGLLTPKIERFVRGYLAGFLSGTRVRRVVEKTVSNTLRLPFVMRVLPDCQVVHLLRDGRDVAASARKQWQAPTEWKRLWKKALTSPKRGFLTYGWDQYFRSRFSGWGRRPRPVPVWGPRFQGVEDALLRHSILEVCALQWLRSVELARESLEEIPRDQWIDVRYEDFVTHPAKTLAGIMDFLELGMTAETSEFAHKRISPSTVGKWRSDITNEELPGVLRLIAARLDREGYDSTRDGE